MSWKLSSGYIQIYDPTHPHSHHGCVYEHRKILELKIGRFLLEDEEVNHIDGNRNNNSLDNLELAANHLEHGELTRKQHIILLGGNPNKDKKCSQCQKLKLKSKFYTNSRLRDYLDNICKQCRKEKERLSRAKIFREKIS